VNECRGLRAAVTTIYIRCSTAEVKSDVATDRGCIVVTVVPNTLIDAPWEQ
jgi:hypothetical protein